MEIRPSGSAASRRAPADYFTGAVWQDPIVEAPAPGNVRASVVRFEPGARTAWHTHPAGQGSALHSWRRSPHPAAAWPTFPRQGEVTMDQLHLIFRPCALPREPRQSAAGHGTLRLGCAAMTIFTDGGAYRAPQCREARR